MQPIFLIGFMCSGKSTLGHALSLRTGIRFIDLDQFIEERAGMTVRQIFDEKGEDFFRQLEREALAQVADTQDVIVACGGGTPCQPGAMDLMNAKGVTVRLVPNEHALLRRLMAGRHKRPLLASISSYDEMRDFMVFTQAKREPFYSKARHRFDSSRLESNDEVRSTVSDFIARFLS